MSQIIIPITNFNMNFNIFLKCVVTVLYMFCGGIAAESARTPSRRLGWKQSSSLRAIQRAACAAPTDLSAGPIYD